MAEVIQNPNLYKYLGARSCNTLHGINPHAVDKHIIGICFKLDTEHNPNKKYQELTTEDYRIFEKIINTNLGCEFVTINMGPSRPPWEMIKDQIVFITSSYGGDIMEIPYTKRKLIPKVIDIALNGGMGIRMQTHLETFYGVNDGPYSLEKSEELFLIKMNQADEFTKKYIHEQKFWYLADHRLWKTEHGKEFARQLQRQYPEKIRELKLDEPIYLPKTGLEDPAIDYPLEPPTPITAPIPILHSKMLAPLLDENANIGITPPSVPNRLDPPPSPEQLETCFICLDRIANTMVLPCEHIVVCTECSAKLGATPDKKTCVKCRCPIGTVLWDGGIEQKQ